MLSGSKTRVFSSALASWVLFVAILLPAPQLKDVTELKQLNNVINVALKDSSSTVTSTNSSSKENLASNEVAIDIDEKVEQESQPESSTTVQSVPTGHSFKSYTNYKLLNSNSPQGRLQKLAYSDENGLRKVGDYYCVALGSYYGTTIGDCYIVTLSSGNQFKITLCDAKADEHTDTLHQYTAVNGCITEFYVDYSCFNSKAKSAGNISVLPGFEGSIVKIEKLDRVNIFNIYK